MSLDEIEAEISSIQKLPIGKRSVLDTDRLADLKDARRRITGESRLRGGPRCTT
jgi:hypothetical protein